MANIQIPNLPAVVNLSGAELLEAVQSGSSVKVSLNQIAALFQIGTPLTFPLQVAIGGTGTTTSTGTGSVVLSDNPTLINPTFVGATGAFALGSVGAPSITFTGDTNTGIWSPGADTMAVSTAGTERIRITSAGNVGIGTTAPSAFGIGYTTVTTQGAAAGIFEAKGALGSVLRVQADSAIGILDVNSNHPMSFRTNAIERMRISAAGTVFVGNGETSTAPASGVLQGTGGSGTDIAGANMNFWGGRGTGTGAGGVVTFATAPAGGVSGTTLNGVIERMRIDSAGNVGVGTLSPVSKLNAVGDQLVVSGGSGLAGIGIQIKGTAVSSIPAAQAQSYIASGDASMGTNGDLLIASRTSAATSIRFITGTSPAERLRIHPTGGVSIGNTTDPGATNLSVTGAGSLGLGTALLPSITFNGDLNTGMWSPAADTVAFSTNGAERMRIDSAGRVGIGTNAVTYTLDVRDPTGATISAQTASGNAAIRVASIAGGTASVTLTSVVGTQSIVGGLGGTNNMVFSTNSVERLRIADAGQIGIGGANYGTAGQTIISAGAAAAPAWGTLGLAGGGTGATTAPAAAAVLLGYTATATAAGTTVLTNTSTQYQLFSGTLTQTITLPVTSTLTTGWSFHIVNNSTGNLTLNSSGGNLVATIIPGSTVMVTCILTSGTTAASWEFGYTDFGTLTGTGSVVMSDGASAAFALGAVGTPSISFTGDLNTGIWSPAADTVAVSTAGAERLRVSSAGDITQLNAVSGAGAIVGEQTFRLAADGSAIGPTIADFFGATSAVSLEASSVYEVTIYAVFTKTTAGTATWTLTASAAPTRMIGTYQASPITGIAAGADTSGFAGSQGVTTAAFAATGSLTTAVNHVYQIVAQVQTNGAANFRLQLTQSAGTATPLAGSYYTVKKISSTTGTFV